MKRHAAVISVAIFSVLIIGCSAFYESAGIPPTDLSALYVGMWRDDAEKILGLPESESTILDGGFVANYFFDRGYRPPEDSKFGRSMAYEAADIVTLGSYSLGTISSQKAVLRVEYDVEGRILRATERMKTDCSVYRGNWSGETCGMVQRNLYHSTLPTSLSSPQ